MSHAVAVEVIAQKTGEAAEAGPIGLAVILLLCIASYFLFKSMSRHMRNVRENFPAEPPVQRVKAPSVHPNAVPGSEGPALTPRIARPDPTDPQMNGDDPDVPPAGSSSAG